MANPVLGTQTINQDNGSAPSFSHDNGSGTNRVLFVTVQMYLNSGGTVPTVTAMTYNSVACTHIPGADSHGSTSSRRYATTHFYLIAPATGSNTLALTLSHTVDYVVTAIPVTGADQTDPVGDDTVQNITGTTYTLSFTTEEDDSVLICSAAMRNNAAPFTPTSPAIEITDTTEGSIGANVFYRTTTTAGAYDCESAGDTDQNFGAGGVEIKPAAAPSTDIAILRRRISEG